MKNLDLIVEVANDIINEHDLNECEFNDSYVHKDTESGDIIVSIIAKNGFLIDIAIKENELISSIDDNDEVTIDKKAIHDTIQQSISDGINRTKDILYDQLKDDGYYDAKGLLEDKIWFDEKAEELNLI